MKYQDTSGNVIEVSSPELNPQLIAGKTLVSDSIPLSTLTGTSQPLTPVQPNPTLTPSVSGLNAELDKTYQLTPEEQKAQTIYNRLGELTGQTVGESAYRTGQEAEQGIPELIKTQSDLSSRLKGLQNEALAIPLQLQEQVRKGGNIVTAGGLQPIQTAALRNNAIQALSTSSLLEASRGNLTTAMTLVDRAVQQKFQPIREEIDANTKNLQLILQSPEYTNSQKKRAQMQIDIQDERKRALETQEKDQKDIYILATKAAESGADASTLQKIQDSKTPFEALQIAANAGLFTQGQKINSQVVKLDNGNTVLLNTDTGKVIANLGGAKPLTTPSGGQGRAVSTITQSIVNNPSLFDDLTPTVKGQVITELQAGGYDTTNLGVKGLSDTAIKEIAQTQKALSDLDTLKSTIQGNEQYIGPISGLQRFNPYSKARQIQADVDRVKQTVGRALEGGVLRKEDEEKYKKILATLSDTPSTAIYKIDALISSIQRDIQNYKQLQGAAGRSLNVKQPLGKTGATTDLRSKYNY